MFCFSEIVMFQFCFSFISDVTTVLQNNVVVEVDGVLQAC